MEIPLNIKTWLNSEPMIAVYEELAGKFNFDISVLTLTLYYLESKQISPENFAIELQKRAGRELPPELLQQIVEKILTPIKNNLSAFGIDIGLIPTAPSPAVATPTPQTEPLEMPISVIPATPSEIQPSPATPSPYILHEEAAFKTLAEEHDINYEPIRQAFFSSSQAQPTFRQPAQPARIQFGGYKEPVPTEPIKPQPPAIGRTEVFAPKIVHYSSLKTPLNPPTRSETPAPQPTVVPTEPAPAIISPAKFNDRVIENTAKSAASPENKKIDLRDLPL
ncbi:MAG: hypothetical protein M1586_02570 [Patescibacteria group bacterium]|nr:hypothetical protein [Patescibacteria group bacterium]MCL5262156.1 hypothetical protein [Patescibacteria group bacterium]